jgi:hypothetical protein
MTGLIRKRDERGTGNSIQDTGPRTEDTGHRETRFQPNILSPFP